MSSILPNPERERLAALRGYSILDTAPEAAFDEIARLAATLCETPFALISLIDADRQWFKSRLGLDAPELPRAGGFCGYTILQPGLLEVEDAKGDERFIANPLVQNAPHIRSYAGVPLLDSEGYALGALSVLDAVPRRLTAAQAEGLRVLAAQVLLRLQYHKQVVQLEQVGIKAGLTKKQVDAYLTSLGLIKPSYSTTIKVNTSGLDSALSTTQQLIRALGNVPSGSIPVIGSRAVSARAGGGPVTANNTYLVGESGPEIVTFGASGYVTPNAMLKPAVLSGTGGLGAVSGGGTVVYQYIVNVAGSVLTEKRLVDVVRTQVLQYNGRNSGNGLSLTR